MTAIKELNLNHINSQFNKMLKMLIYVVANLPKINHSAIINLVKINKIIEILMNFIFMEFIIF